MKLKILLPVLMLSCFIALAGGNVHAIVISDSDSFDGVLTELVNEPLRVERFNGALGTLNRVTVTLGGSLATEGGVVNTAANPQSFTVSSRAQQYDGTKTADAPDALPSPFNIFEPFDLIGEQDYVDLPPNEPADFGPFVEVKGPLTALDTTDAGEMSQFEGAGLFGYDFNTIIATIISGAGGNVIAELDTVASAVLTVEYEFTEDVVTPIPEPTTIVLFGLGLLGMGAAFRRKLKK